MREPQVEPDPTGAGDAGKNVAGAPQIEFRSSLAESGRSALVRRRQLADINMCATSIKLGMLNEKGHELVAAVNDGSGAAARWLGDVFKSVDWLIPAYLTLGFIHRLAGAIHQAKPADRLEIFREAITVIYGPQYLATSFLERYSKILHVQDFSRQIDESFRAYFAGYRLVAITAMIPVLEGIIRKIASAASRDVGQGTKKSLYEFDAIVEAESNFPHRYEERLVMLELLRDFMRDRFLQNTNRYDGLNQFNRHGILHGVFDDFGEELNFMRVILDLLCFIIGLKGASVSMFAPDDTDESEKLASQYIALQKLSSFPPAEIPARVLELLTN